MNIVAHSPQVNKNICIKHAARLQTSRFLLEVVNRFKLSAAAQLPCQFYHLTLCPTHHQQKEVMQYCEHN
jgi:hypothetical protein